MPHLIVEVTKDLERQINVPNLVKELHLSLRGSKGLDMKRVKSRSYICDKVLNGDNAEVISMIHVSLDVLSGRDAETKKQMGHAVYKTLKEFCKTVTQPLSLTVEVRDMDKEFYFRD